MNRLSLTLLCFTAVALLAISSSGCGYRGPLYLPEEEAEQASSETGVETEDPEEKKTER